MHDLSAFKQVSNRLQRVHIDNFEVRFRFEANDQTSRAHISRFPVNLFEAERYRPMGN